MLGVGQTASAEDMTDSLRLLNMMMAQWQRRRYMVYQLVNASKVATGQVSYTVGPGADFDIARPSKLESAFFRQQIYNPLPVDYPLSILRAREDYNRIGLKTLQSFPQYAFYDAGSPWANLYIWPIPTNQYEIFITVMQQLQRFESVNDVIALPPEYEAALMWNLVLELYPFYGLPASDVTRGKAEASMRIIEEANAQIPKLIMPIAVQGKAGSYNIYGDYYIGSNG